VGSTDKSNLACLMRYGDPESIAAKDLKLLPDKFKLIFARMTFMLLYTHPSLFGSWNTENMS
jgi:hypothetical protein